MAKVKKNQTSAQPEQSAFVPVVNFDVLTRFKETLVAIGGRVIEIDKGNDLHEVLLSLFPSLETMNIVIPSLGKSIERDREKFSKLDVAVLSGEFGVAENGSVWVTDKAMGDRVIPFICEHLVLIISRSSIVATMHQAYDRIDTADYDFGTFIAGPSKTADIEQSLVLGAHGAKSMTALLVG